MVYMTCNTLLTTTITAKGIEKKRKISVIITALGYQTSNKQSKGMWYIIGTISYAADRRLVKG